METRIYTEISNLSQVITFAYELRFTRSLCLRTRFDESYNFHEGSFPKFGTYKKSNFKPLFYRIKRYSKFVEKLTKGIIDIFNTIRY